MIELEIWEFVMLIVICWWGGEAWGELKVNKEDRGL